MIPVYIYSFYIRSCMVDYCFSRATILEAVVEGSCQVVSFDTRYAFTPN